MAQSMSAARAARSKARFVPPPVPAVTMNGFWGERIETIRTVTAPSLRRRCEEAGMLEQVDVRLPVPPLRIPFQSGGLVTTQMFWDSDLAKTIETAAYCLIRTPDPALEASTDELIELYGALQGEDGYCNSWYIRMQPGLRWTNMRDCHELYCAGHLIEAAVAYYEATGKRRLLDILSRYVAHIATVIGNGDGQKPGYPGHQEIELALIKLYRITNDPAHLALARYFIDQRGTEPKYFPIEAEARNEEPGAWAHTTAEYNQWHAPVREQDKVVGHAVRAMYMYAGMADIAAEQADRTLQDALERLWDDLTSKRLYVTGGMGPSEHNEGFTEDYDLPNENAYAETCAAVGLVFWAQRMLGLSLDRRYGDTMELALYNGVLSGLSRDGAHFFYDNPLESRGDHHRWSWHRCPCCPPNVARLLASLGSYAYGEGHNELAVHLYGSSEARLSVLAGAVTLTQHTDYPWDDRIEITVTAEGPRRFALLLRIPGWCRTPELSINGEKRDAIADLDHGYVRVEREWQSGDQVLLTLPMLPQRLYAHPSVRADAGSVALRRGPLVYCIEGIDNGEDLHRLSLPPGSQIEAKFEPGLLGGVTTLQVGGRRDVIDDWSDTIYRDTQPDAQPAIITAIPYYLWDNREPGEMRVWLRASPQEAA